MSQPLNITVAGAGIGGLAAANAFARRGHRVVVAEKAAEIGEVGAGIQISPNGMAVMRALGVEDALAAVSLRAAAVRLYDGLSGREVVTLDLTKMAAGMEWRLVHRARLIEVLLAAAEGAGVRVDTGRAIEPPPAGAALADDDLLIGADGLHSAMRARVDEASKPFFTKQVAWRAIVPGDGVPVIEVHMGPGRHIVSYPLPGGLRNIVAVEERDAWAEEGWSHSDHPGNLRAAFASFASRPRAWLDAVEDCFLWGLFRHRIADRWHTGAQVLMGDAAHPTLPFLAQGANLALEDAWVLASALDRSGVAQGLVAYEQARRARVRRVVDAAGANARNYHLRLPPVRFAAHSALRLIGTLAPSQPLRRFDWLYKYDVTTEA